MYLEHEELLKMANTLEQERDQARGEAHRLAVQLRSARQNSLMGRVEGDLLNLVIQHDPTTQFCNDIIKRYTP